MRIGFIIYGSLDTLTGGYLYDKFVVEGLRKLGHNVEIVSLKSGSYLQQIVYGFSPWLHDRLLTERYDLLIQDELCHPSLIMANRRIRQQSSTLLISLVHHTLSEEPRNPIANMFFAAMERLYLSTVHGFILNSESTRKQVESLAGHNLPAVVAYPAGDRFGAALPLSTIENRVKSSERLELLFLGNVISRKGLIPLLEVLAKVDRSMWRLSVVGGLDFDPGYTAKVKEIVTRFGITKNVHFHGTLQDDGLIAIMQNCHLFCMPYAYEGFGIAILESMGFGLPALGSSAGAASETIIHGKNGYLISPEDKDQLAKIVTELYHNRDTLLTLSLGAIETYNKAPGWQDSVIAINDFLENMYSDSGATKNVKQ